MKPNRKKKPEKHMHPESENTAMTLSEQSPDTVDAKILYRYLLVPNITYWQWLCGHVSHLKECRKPVDKFVYHRDDEFEIEVSFALGLALDRSGLLAGAAALILIVENTHPSVPKNIGKTDAALRRYFSMVASAKWANARALHGFLEVTETYNDWIQTQLKSHRMQLGRDYVHADKKDAHAPNQGEIFLHYKLAEKIALHAGTFRSGCVLRAINAYKRSQNSTAVDTLRLCDSFVRPAATPVPNDSSPG